MFVKTDRKLPVHGAEKREDYREWYSTKMSPIKERTSLR